MPWVAPVMAVVGAAAAVAGVVQSKKQAEIVKKQAEHNAQLAAIENARQRKLQVEENEEVMAAAQAKAAASGTSGVSESIFLNQLKKKGIEELKWLDTVGAANLKGTQFEGKTAIGAAQGRVVGSFGQFAQSTAHAGTVVNEFRVANQ